MKPIYLKGKHGSKAGNWAFVSDEDYVLVMKYRWVASLDPKSKKIYGRTESLPRTRMHVLIMNTKGNNSIVVDHIDGDSLNNQRENLRIATITQNNQNVAKRKNASSKYKGVIWSKQHNKWRVRITLNKKTISFGLYDSEEEAAKVYDLRAKEYFKEFARLNFKEDNNEM